MIENNGISPRPVSVDEVYSLDVLSVCLDVPKRRLADEIKDGRLKAASLNRNSILVPGWAVLQWVSHACQSDDD